MFFKNVNNDMRQENPVKWYILSIIRAIIVGLLAVFVVAAGFLLIATALEYRPEARESVEAVGTAESFPAEEQELTIMTWNIGYGALGDNTDYFLDGGNNVKTADAARVEQNLTDIVDDIREIDPDVFLLQEIDRNSARSSKINELERMQTEFPDRQSVFANNYRAFFIPYPVPPIGKVDAGLATFSRYELSGAERISLTNAYKWPIRTLNMKRCLLASRIDLPDTDAELVLVNLHLDARNAAARQAQTTELREFMDAERDKGNYVIAGGDFNQMFPDVDPEGYLAYESLWQPDVIDSAPFGDAWQFAMDDAVPTCRSLFIPYADSNKEKFQYYVIDGFIVSDNLELVSCETLDRGFVASDHNPVVLKVRF